MALLILMVQYLYDFMMEKTNLGLLTNAMFVIMEREGKRMEREGEGEGEGEGREGKSYIS